MFFTVLLVYVIAFLTVRARVQAVRNRKISINYFKLMQGEEVPDTVIKTTRHFNNMFEMPVLYFVVCSLYLALNIDSQIALYLAWMFLGFRIVHAYIHITYNNSMHRLGAFMGGNVCILVLWLNLLIHAT